MSCRGTLNPFAPGSPSVIPQVTDELAKAGALAPDAALPESARPWVPHPSSARVGKHEPSLTGIQEGSRGRRSPMDRSSSMG
jgi:hypothetical protein